MLRASRTLLRPGGATAYFTIVPAPKLSKTQQRRAVRLGPRAVYAQRPMDELMKQAGFQHVRVEDVTEDFLRTARAWANGFDEHEDELRALPGIDWEERQRDRRGIISAIEEGLLLRLMVSA